MRGLLNPNWLS